MRLLVLSSTLVAGLASAQVVVPWASETQGIPSTRTGDVAAVATMRLGPSSVYLDARVIGADVVQVGGYVWNVFGGGLQQVLPVGAVSGVDAKGTLLVLATANAGVLGFGWEADGGFVQYQHGAFGIASPGAVALKQNGPHEFELAVDTRGTLLKRFAVSRDGGALSFTPLADFTLPESASGLAYDSRTGRLFASQPRFGVLAIDPDGTKRFVISIDGGALGPTVGGLDVLPLNDGGLWVFNAVSSRDEVAVHELDLTLFESTFVGSARFGPPDGGASRVRQPSHLALFPVPMPGAPQGVLIVQDEAMANYKVISLDVADGVLPLPDFIPSDDAGVADAGSSDAGTVDGGSPDAGAMDGGGPVGGGGGTGGRPGPMPGSDPLQRGCGCNTSTSILVLPFVLLWWIRRLRQPTHS